MTGETLERYREPIIAQCLVIVPACRYLPRHLHDEGDRCLFAVTLFPPNTTTDLSVSYFAAEVTRKILCDHVIPMHNSRTGAILRTHIVTTCCIILRSPSMFTMLASPLDVNNLPSIVEAADADSDCLPAFHVAASTTPTTKLWCSGHFDSGRCIRGKILDTVADGSPTAEPSNTARAAKSEPSGGRSTKDTSCTDQVSAAKEI